MKKTIDLLNEVVTMGFTREEALEQIDAAFDDVFGFENRKELATEEISDELYEDTLLGFRCMQEGRNIKL